MASIKSILSPFQPEQASHTLASLPSHRRIYHVFQVSRVNSVSSKGSKRKVRKLALEAVEKREMLSISNPLGLCTAAAPVVRTGQPSIIAPEVSQSSDVAVSFAGDGHLNLNVYDSQTVYTQAQAGRATSTGLVSQSLDVDVSFAGDGSLGLDVHDSQTAYAQTQAGRASSTRAWSRRVWTWMSASPVTGTWAWMYTIRRRRTPRPKPVVSAAPTCSRRVPTWPSALPVTGVWAWTRKTPKRSLPRPGPAEQSRESVSQQSAVDAYFEGVGSVSLSAENSQSMFTQASFHHGRHRPANRKEYHHDHFMHIRPGPVAMPAQGTAIDSLFATGLDPADIHSGWNDNVDDPRRGPGVDSAGCVCTDLR